MNEPGLPEKVLALDAVLDAAAIDHAFGGAIALGYFAMPRATIDVDCNVFVTVDDRDRVAGAVATLGVKADQEDTRLVIDHQVRWWWGRTPIDLFFSYDPFHDAMARGIRRVPFGDRQIPVLGPEHLVVCKVVFDRRKDWLDLEQVLVGVEGFDAVEVRSWLDRIVGAGDPRAQRFDVLAARLLGA